MNNEPSFDALKSEEWKMEYHGHSYGNFVKSFKMNWENHINSLNKSKNSYTTSIFLVHYPEIALSMNIDYEPLQLKSEIEYGDLLYRLPFKFYRISRDKDLLKYVYDFKELVDYLIFYGYQCIDVIKIANIPEILKLLFFNYRITSVGFVGEFTCITGISIKNNDCKEGEKNERPQRHDS